MDGKAQSGIVGCAAIDDYRDGKIKKHEFTRVDGSRQDKSFLYARQIRSRYSCSGKNDALKDFIDRYTEAHAPEYDLITDDGVTQILWVVGGEGDIREIESIFRGTR